MSVDDSDLVRESVHLCQQDTCIGKLTSAMLRSVLERATELAGI
ncbi:hypothetical protein BJ970_001100 [Saccharopolyspora phatthalungensis]|uniref:Uncharacterized protein n=1 Tax=Saccharopolyspora phatthalungensis TaxID=664693 RepID=A0A840PZ42_9PSEU|nr:hypothetical protein [Saccharopolyspora phatthalungensis]